MAVEMALQNIAFKDLELNYLALRKAEGRVYKDAELQLLPNLPVRHMHHKEWLYRKDSFKRLCKILPSAPAKILDLGCGNGWMSNALAQLGFKVTGLDVNLEELQQANRVFKDKNLRWVYADVFQFNEENSYDFVVISATLQYFKQPNLLFKHLFKLLKKTGKLIVMDTHLYPPSVVDTAAERSSTYYHSMNAEFMIDHYFHHSAIDFNPFGFKYVYNPKHPIIQKWSGASPFPILEITQ